MRQRARQGKAGQKPRQNQKKQTGPPAIQKGAGHAAQREGQHDGGMQTQAFARTGPSGRVNRMEKPFQPVRQFQPHIGEHSCHMGGADTRPGNACDRGVLEPHEETQPVGQHRIPWLGRKQKIHSPQKPKQAGFQQNAPCVDRRQVVATARIDQQRGQGVRRLDLLLHRVDSRIEAIRVATAMPVRDVKRLTRLLCEKIETIDPGFGIERMVLIASLAEPMDQRQTVSSLIAEEEVEGSKNRLSRFPR
ncbi:hypothetical protein APA22_41300 (plasmid) [Acetobacter pasteurianus IFO 3283-22]|nr:hypothetical protein APA01_41300 [Acetobacter pasteurianus IFO 3283-01]BAI03965.1 hypothetical protein APA03_41300 [Acetobacter pasteurianus IFO 3283-03]BAI07012.1 hypothetical protein APA07_41300 [Acetobacter pasteurianus IFO 3283-07]BAI10060.1 hypothetical protein APA22_41300 [Acetobacter pasteurianus IFO 3283-22]BAI13108.1 hypothetical protein APA26_41300 [Acetobacter pasteurianus IFO 3283-26]BAI16154.1 hypothetical protein APA32_41300 [Acetobacter pasteurianus IFO 3283-32]BAI19138.1 hy